MFINALGCYVPEGRIANSYFAEKLGVTEDWIVQRTGINSRSKAAAGEDHNTMGLRAIDDALVNLTYDIREVDLIVSACYSPYDTVATLAHIAQQKYEISGAKALYISSACSSFINGLEVIEGYFAMNKASKALLICSEHNTYYSNDNDPKSGHLWGDGAVAYFLSKDRLNDNDYEIKSIYTCGLGNVGKGPEGVRLRVKEDGISMPDGKDVFMNACKYMIAALQNVTSENNLEINDLDYIICHQANMRIVKNVAHTLDMKICKFLNNIAELGNTGSASAPLVLVQNKDKLKKGMNIGLTVFGGGYSCGAFLVEI